MSLWRTTISPDAYRRVTALALVAPKVQLRALIVGVDAADWGVASWQQTVDRLFMTAAAPQAPGAPQTRRAAVPRF